MSEPSQVEAAPHVAPRSRRKLIAIVVAGVVVLVGVASALIYFLNQRAQAPLCLANMATTANTIKVGFTIAMTGQYSVEGTNSIRGILTAANWINTHGGVNVSGTSYQVVLDCYDDQSSSTNVNNLYPKIIQQDGAQFLLAPYSTSLTGTAAPYADGNNELMLSHGGAADTLWTTTSRKNLVEVLSPASAYLRGAIDWIKTNHPSDRLAALYANDAFSSLATQSAIAYAQSRGLQVVYNASYPSMNTPDLSSQLTAAKTAGADDLIGGGHFTDGQLIMTDLITVWTPKLVSLLVAVTEPTFFSGLGVTANNVTGPSQWETAVGYSPALAASRGLPWFGPTPAQFTSLYGNLTAGLKPSYHSGEAAAALLVLADAIEQTGNLTTAGVRATLGNLHMITFFGEFQINSQGLQTAHTMVLVQWQAGSLKVIYPAAVAETSVQYPYTGS